MKNFTFVIALLISFNTVFANTITTKRPKKRKKSNTECIMTNKNDLLKTIISYSDIKSQFEISTRRGSDIKVFQNEFIDQTTDVSINYQKVLIVDNHSRYPDALVIDFSQIDCENNIVEFAISSRVKGIEIVGGLKFVNEQWQLQIFSQNNI